MPQFKPMFDLLCLVKSNRKNISIKINGADIPVTKLENAKENNLTGEKFITYESVSTFVDEQISYFKKLTENNLKKVKILLNCKNPTDLKKIVAELNQKFGDRVSVVVSTTDTKALIFNNENAVHQVFLTSV